MTIKQKFERIDQSKLEPNQVNALKIVVEFTENFKTKDAEKIKVTNEKLDNIIEKLQVKNPDALKPLKTATAKKQSQTSKPKRTVLGLAKEIRKSDESFEDAKARATKIINEEKDATNKVVKSEMKSLLEFIKKHKELEGINGTDLGRDASRVAKRGGVRTVTHSGSTTNQYGTFENHLGRKYSENRENRKDRLAPNYPQYAPLLEKGGAVSEIYFFQCENKEIRDDFFEDLQAYMPDHSKMKMGDLYIQLEASPIDEENLQKMANSTDGVNFVVEKYNDGGYLTNPTFGQFQNIVYKDGGQVVKPHYQVIALEKRHNLQYGDSKRFATESEAISWGEKQFSREDVGEVVVDRVRPNDKGEIKIDTVYRINNDYPLGERVIMRPITYSKGGMLSSRERYVLEVKGQTGLSVGAIEKYIDDNNLSEGELLNIVVGLGRKQLKGADVATAVNGKPKNALSKEIIAFAKSDKAMKLELGGNVGAYDLAGHLGGNFNVGQNNGNLSGTTGTFYTGLVGETGTMSSGEMFELGGGVPSGLQGAVQTYTNAYANEGATAGMYAGGGVIDGALNKQVHALALKEKMTINDWATSEYNKRITQALVESLTDANFHNDAKKVVMKAEGKKTFTKELFKSEYYNPSQDVLDFARDVARICDYDGDDIVNAYYFTTKMQGSKVATMIEDLFLNKKTSSKKYVPHYDIESVTVKKGKKQIVIKGSDVLNGANMLKKGGDLSKSATYFPKRDIVSVKLKNGEVVHPANGYWVGITPKMVRTQFEESAFEYKAGGVIKNQYLGKSAEKVWGQWNESQRSHFLLDHSEILDKDRMENNLGYSRIVQKDKKYSELTPHTQRVLEAHVEKGQYEEGGKVEEAIINKDGIKVKSVAMPEKKLSEAEWMEKHSETNEARAYASGGEIRVGDKVKVKASGIGEDYVIVEGFDSPKQVLTKNDNPNTYLAVRDNEGYAWEIYLKEVVEFPSNTYAKGGKVTFAQKAKAIAKNFEGKQVEPKYQKEYGKTYDKAEAKEVGNKIAGAQKAKYDSKMKSGGKLTNHKGSPKMNEVVAIAKKIRKEGEAWASALKRAWAQVK
jgi:hypothetical protein